MSTLGHEVQNSQETENILSNLVDHVSKIESQIKGPRPSNPEQKNHFDQLLKAAADVRGRPLYYNYVGSGAGRGVYVELEDGSVKLDLINGIGVHIFGHSDPRVMKAYLRGALSDVVNQGNLQPNKEYVQLGQKLIQLASKKSKLRHVWLTTCGSRANEKALRVSRQRNSPARMVIAMERAFAGRTTMMSEITDNPEYKVGLPEYNEILRVPFYDKKDPKSAERSLSVFKQHLAKHEKNISAFSFEMIQGEGGFRVGTKEFFLPMLELCKQHHIAVWVDEVQTFGRTGELFAFEKLDLGNYVDICTIAKVLQVGAVMYTDDYNPKPGLLAGTFSGTSAALSAGHEILSMLEGGGYMGQGKRIDQIHQKFQEGFKRLNTTTCKGLVNDGDGLGLMIAVTPLDGSKDKIQKLLKVMFDNGLMSFSCGRDPYKVRFLVPANIQDQDIELALSIFEKSILQVANEA